MALLTFLGAFCCSLVIIIVPVLITMQLEGGILYYLTFGFVPAKGYIVNPDTRTVVLTETAPVETKDGSIFGDIGGNVVNMFILNALLYFGMVEVFFSFLEFKNM